MFYVYVGPCIRAENEAQAAVIQDLLDSDFRDEVSPLSAGVWGANHLGTGSYSMSDCSATIPVDLTMELIAKNTALFVTRYKSFLDAAKEKGQTLKVSFEAIPYWI